MFIGVISDTHGVLPEEVKKFLVPVDEVWHAGDFGGGAEFAGRIRQELCGDKDALLVGDEAMKVVNCVNEKLCGGKDALFASDGAKKALNGADEKSCGSEDPLLAGDEAMKVVNEATDKLCGGEDESNAEGGVVQNEREKCAGVSGDFLTEPEAEGRTEPEAVDGIEPNAKGGTEQSLASRKIKTFRAVSGNCDGQDIRRDYPESLFFEVEGLKVLMTHIGGYPGRYDLRAEALIDRYKPDIFVCGHSHILKVMNDAGRNMLTINPGACGNQGWHVLRTALRFHIDKGKIHDMEVLNLPRN